MLPFLALVFFDFYIGRWDILPDALGYFGLFVCFTALLERDRSFVKPQNFALLLFLLELSFLFGLVSNPGLVQVLRLIGSFGDLLMVAYAAKALSALSGKLDRPELAGASESAMYFFLPTVPLGALAMFIPDLAGLMGYVCVILYLVSLYRFYSVYKNMLTRADIPLDLEEP